MAKFGSASKANLAQAHPLLQQVFNEVIKTYDCTILDAQRGRAEQEKAFAQGFSKAHFGQSPHNFSPAVALDVIPYPFAEKDWKDIPRFRAMAAVVLATARKMGFEIVWGGSFKSIKDYDHFELANWKDLVATGKVKPYRGDD